MPIATAVPIVAAGLIGFGAVFVALGYLVRQWQRLLLADILVVAGLAAIAVVWPRGTEVDAGALLGLLAVLAIVALMFTGLGVAARSVLRPHDERTPAPERVRLSREP